MHYYTTIDEAIGTFYTYVSEDSTTQNFGGLWLYYDEKIEDRLTANSDIIGSNIYVKNIPINSLNLANKNVIINGQTLTHFKFTPDQESSYYGHTEYYVDGYAGKSHIYSKRIKIWLDFGYVDDGVKREYITLLNEGDFTTIKRRDLSDITVRTENILRKVKA